MDYVSTSIGTKISAPLYLSIGYFGVFGCSASVCVLALLFLLFFVKESLKNTVNSDAVTSTVTPLTDTHYTQYGSQEVTQSEDDTAVTVRETGAKTNFVMTSLMFVLSSVKAVLMPRAGHRRLVVLLGVFNFMCYIFTYNGTEGTHRLDLIMGH